MKIELKEMPKGSWRKKPKKKQKNVSAEFLGFQRGLPGIQKDLMLLNVLDGSNKGFTITWNGNNLSQVIDRIYIGQSVIFLT